MYVTQSYHWDGSSRLQICYITAGNSQALTAIDQAVAEYHSRTCLRFERRTSQRAYIEFFKGGG